MQHYATLARKRVALLCARYLTLIRSITKIIHQHHLYRPSFINYFHSTAGATFYHLHAGQTNLFQPSPSINMASTRDYLAQVTQKFIDTSQRAKRAFSRPFVCCFGKSKHRDGWMDEANPGKPLPGKREPQAPVEDLQEDQSSRAVLGHEDAIQAVPATPQTPVERRPSVCEIEPAPLGETPGTTNNAAYLPTPSGIWEHTLTPLTPGMAACIDALLADLDIEEFAADELLEALDD